MQSCPSTMGSSEQSGLLQPRRNRRCDSQCRSSTGIMELVIGALYVMTTQMSSSLCVEAWTPFFVLSSTAIIWTSRGKHMDLAFRTAPPPPTSSFFLTFRTILTALRLYQKLLFIPPPLFRLLSALLTTAAADGGGRGGRGRGGGRGGGGRESAVTEGDGLLLQIKGCLASHPTANKKRALHILFIDLSTFKILIPSFRWVVKK